MATKPELLETILDQSQSQVEFGDHKASLLVAGDAVLLAITGELIKVMSGQDCAGDQFALTCMEPTASLSLAMMTALFLTVSLVCALIAARPAKIHDNPPPRLFLLSYVALLDREDFARRYLAASPEQLFDEALASIHGRSVYATRKFRWLKRAIDMTMVSIGVMLIAITIEVIR